MTANRQPQARAAILARRRRVGHGHRKPIVGRVGVHLSQHLRAGCRADLVLLQAADPFDFKSLESFVTFIKVFLLAFAGIALFVGAFIIFNTFAITVAQRTREFALLRTIGASRRQVLRSVVLEAFVIGLAAVPDVALGFPERVEPSQRPTRPGRS